MGRELFDRYPELSHAADGILGYSIQDLCLGNPQGKLRQTEFTQPALFVVGALSWLERQKTHPPPAFLAGHSLGEYSALFAAGCFDFETGLRLVQQRGALMSRVEDGGMAAVLGLEEEQIREVLETEGATVDVANFNLPTQLVLAGPRPELERLTEPLEAAGARRYLVLNVSGAFHSRYMAPVAEEFEAFLRGFTFQPPRIPVIANATAKPYEAGSVAAGLVEQIRSSVRWSQTQERLYAEGVREIEELGPGKVLTKLWAGFLETVGPTAEGGAHDEAARRLGDGEFRREYGLGYAYVAGASAPGVRTPAFVEALASAGCLTFLDDRSLDGEPDALEASVAELRRRLGPERSFGLRLEDGQTEDGRVDLALAQEVPVLEAAGYHRITLGLVRARFRGSRRDGDGRPVAARGLLALVSRPAVAKLFLAPAPEHLVAALEAEGKLTAAEGEAARSLPLASDLCALSGEAEGGDLSTLLPALMDLRERARREHGYGLRVRVGAGGAIGAPEAMACAFFLGADFVQTGCVNLCCREAAVATAVQEILAGLEAGETVSAPAEQGFSLGARAQVVKKGSFFAPRAQKLYELFRFYDSLEAIDPAHREKVETTYFKRSFGEVWKEIEASLSASGPSKAQSPDAKARMALVFRWYLRRSLAWALDGVAAERVSYRIPCDESMAAFNRFAAGTALASPSQRTAPKVAQALLQASAALLAQRSESA